MTSKEAMVWAATAWLSNADLIAACVRLGYLRDDDAVLDPTYGRGMWWAKWRPANLTTHHRPDDGSDFRCLPYADATFDAVAYDPPYVCQGSRTTTTVPDFHAAYGLGDAPTTPGLLQDLINDGLTEMYRVVKPTGIVLTKCKDYVSSGHLWLGSHWTLCHALDLGFELVDRLEHIGRPGPQSQTRQVHARRNLSTLFILRRPRD